MRHILHSALIIGLRLVCATSAMAGQPSGTWDVIAVHIDENSMRTQAFTYNDPRLLGRSFSFSGGRISSTAAEGSCPAATYQSATAKTGDVFKKTFGMRTDTVAMQARDFGINLGAATTIPIIWVKCKGSFGLASPNPLITLPTGELLLPWYDGTLLKLQLRSAKRVPRASFPCVKAATPTENAICSSVDLAAFDRSVAVAFANTLTDGREQGADVITALKNDQRNWLAKRNQCGSDGSCLQKSMTDRLDKLTGGNN